MNTKAINILAFLVIVFSLSLPILAATPEATVMVYTVYAPTMKGDSRRRWYDAALELALQKTTSKYGPYEIQTLPHMSHERSNFTLKSNAYSNFVTVTPFRVEDNQRPWLKFIFFPVNLGLANYRICFYSQAREEYIYKHIEAKNFSLLSYGQGRGWTDVRVLRSNGLNVIEVDNYESLFAMTSVGRFDLFCRSLTEVLDEHERFSEKYKLGLDKKFAFYYMQPFFFVLNKLNQRAIQRLEQGLLISHQDGSLLSLFLSFHSEKLMQFKLKDRHIVHLENPDASAIQAEYQQYFHHFEE